MLNEFRDKYQNNSCKQNEQDPKKGDDHFFDDLPKTKKRSTTDPDIFLQEQERNTQNIAQDDESCPP